MSHKSNRLKRLLLWAAMVIAILWFGAWLAASWMAPKVLHQVLDRVAAQTAPKGIVLKDLEFGDLSVSPFFNRVRIKDISAKFDLNPKDDIQVQSFVKMRELEVGLKQLSGWRGSVSAHGVELRFDASDLPPSLPYGHLFDGEVEVEDLPLADPRAAFDEVRTGLKELFYEGSIEGDAVFAGRVRIVVDQAETVAQLYTVQEDGRFQLRFDEPSLQSLADQLELDLAPEQIAIVATYPLRVPRIMKITDRARDTAKREARGDKWLKDALRHVSWSFLLTEAFGTEFAQVVTDAQEMRPGNTPDERAMDFHNNAVGRLFSAEGLGLKELIERVRSDPKIIRNPDEVGSFAGELMK